MDTNTEERVVGGLTHVLLLFSWVGLVINVLLYVLYRQRSAFVSGHAKQALGLQVVGLIVGAVLGLLFGASVGFSVITAGAALGGVLLGAVLSLLLGIVWLVLIIMAAIAGFTGKEYRHPVIGKFLEGLDRH